MLNRHAFKKGGEWWPGSRVSDSGAKIKKNVGLPLPPTQQFTPYPKNFMASE